MLLIHERPEDFDGRTKDKTAPYVAPSPAHHRAFVAARTRDVAAGEDALGDSFVAALNTWPRDGVPANPAAWLLTAARRRLIDQQRAGQHVQSASELVLEQVAEKSTTEAEPFPD